MEYLHATIRSVYTEWAAVMQSVFEIDAAATPAECRRSEHSLLRNL